MIFLFVEVGLRCPIRWWGGAARVPGFPLFEGRVGPAEEPREAAREVSLGVLGPREDCRREEEVAGMERWWFNRLRFEGSVDGERFVPRKAPMAAAAAVEGGSPAVLRGEG